MKNSGGDLGVQTQGLLVLSLPISGEAVLGDSSSCILSVLQQ